MGALALFVADALVALGVFVMTLGVYGMIRFPDTFTRVHGAAKGVFLGVIVLCLATAFTGDPDIIFRLALISVFLLLTTPVSSHVIARSAYLRSERMHAPDPVDESGSELNED